MTRTVIEKRAERSLATAEDQSASFVELFFDVVFVYAVTQLVSLIHDDLTWSGVGRALVVFWLVWWAWTQFTWALNSADTTHPQVELSVLGAAALAFLMAVKVPEAFGDGGLTFAVIYVAVRLLGLAVYWRVAYEDQAKRSAVFLFGGLSLTGLAAVTIGGFLEGDARTFSWIVAIVLDLIAAGRAGRAEGWDIRCEHFAERHGLFVIIVLGESLIAAGAGLTGIEISVGAVGVAVLAVVAICGLWWTYFAAAKPDLDRRLRERDASARSTLARDAYTIAHFPLIFGVVLFAVAIEEAVAHPTDPLSGGVAGALGAGVCLYLVAMAAARVRAGAALPPARSALAGAIAFGVLVTSSLEPAWPLLVVVAGLGSLGFLESREPRRLGNRQATSGG